ncbi:hypothetical protein EXS45_00005 [Candidatus Nomurabacteria bacterium]|nr:hypothetical protein [Candidatus Nomurabacteria bacterium]
MNKDINKNLKDFKTNTDISIKDISFPLSYTKTHKLITALYMVTDILDKDEPLRNKLRTLGLEILSDLTMQNLTRVTFDTQKVDQVLSFLNITFAMNFISEMNCEILKKEFLELKVSIQESRQVKPRWLEEFLSEPLLLDKEEVGGGNSKITTSLRPWSELSSSIRRKENPKGHTRIGVQKGSTLMKALSDKTYLMSNTLEARPNMLGLASRSQDFDLLKKQRRDEIIKIVKIIGGNATIKDIKDMIQSTPEQAIQLVSCSEKTLQRELMSMMKDGVLNKTGEKRWSRYFVK